MLPNIANLLSPNNQAAIEKLFNPLKNTNCRAWYSPYDYHSITSSGGLVSAYKGKQGSSVQISQSTGSKQPTTGTRTIGGKNVFDFNATDLESLFGDVVASGFNGTNVPFSAYAVFQQDNAGTIKTILSLESASTGTPINLMRINTLNRLEILRRDDTGNLKTSGNVIVDYNPHIVVYIFDGTNVKIYLDGNLVVTTDMSTGLGTMTLDRLRIASYRDDASNYFDGAIGDVIVNYGADSDAIRQKIEGYLAWEYSLVYQLPYNHPYFNGSIFGKPYLFYPSQLGSDVKLILATSDLSKLTTSAGACSQINDKLSAGYNFVQATGSKQPIAFTRNINNNNALDLTRASSQDMISTSGLAALFNATNSPFSVYAVVQRDTSGVDQCFFELYSSTGTARLQFYIESVNNRPVVQFISDAGVSVFSATTVSTTTGAHIIAYIYDGTTITVYLDGTSIGAAFRSSGAQTFNRASIGANSDGGNNYWDGLINRVIANTGADTTTERQKIEGQLAHEFNLTANLPSNHPYKTTPPKA